MTQNSAICSNMDGPGKTSICHLFVESKKDTNNLLTRQKRVTDVENNLTVPTAKARAR